MACKVAQKVETFTLDVGKMKVELPLLVVEPLTLTPPDTEPLPLYDDAEADEDPGPVTEKVPPAEAEPPLDVAKGCAVGFDPMRVQETELPLVDEEDDEVEETLPELCAEALPANAMIANAIKDLRMFIEDVSKKLGGR